MLKIFNFKAIFTVLLYILIIYYFFYILLNTKLSFNLNYNNKKIIIKIQKYLLTSYLNFFISKSILIVYLCNQDGKIFIYF
jgi:hypothetical protein